MEAACCTLFLCVFVSLVLTSLWVCGGRSEGDANSAPVQVLRLMPSCVFLIVSHSVACAFDWNVSYPGDYWHVFLCFLWGHVFTCSHRCVRAFVCVEPFMVTDFFHLSASFSLKRELMVKSFSDSFPSSPTTAAVDLSAQESLPIGSHPFNQPTEQSRTPTPPPAESTGQWPKHQACTTYIDIVDLEQQNN